MTDMLRIGRNAMKTNLVRGKTFSYLPIGAWLMNIAHSIFTRQQASVTQKLFIVKGNGLLSNKIMDKVKRIQELRRSNAATAIPSKKKYNRKRKHKNKNEP